MQVQLIPQLPVAGTLGTESGKGEPVASDFLQLWCSLLRETGQGAAVSQGILPPEEEDEAVPEKALPALPEFWASLFYPRLLQALAATSTELPDTSVVAALESVSDLDAVTSLNLLPVRFFTQATAGSTDLPAASPDSPAAVDGKEAAQAFAAALPLGLAESENAAAGQAVWQDAGEEAALTAATFGEEVEEAIAPAQAARKEPVMPEAATDSPVLSRAQSRKLSPVVEFTAPKANQEPSPQDETAAPNLAKEYFKLTASREAEPAYRGQETRTAGRRALEAVETNQPLPAGADQVAAAKTFAMILRDPRAASGEDFMVNVAEQVFAKILYADLPQGEKKLYVRLKPENLGQVEIRLRLNAKQQLIAHIQTDNPQVKQALEATWGQLRERLQAQQITVTEFTVTLGQEQNFAQQQNSWQKNPYFWQKPVSLQRSGRETAPGEFNGADKLSSMNASPYHIIDLRA